MKKHFFLLFFVGLIVSSNLLAQTFDSHLDSKTSPSFENRTDVSEVKSSPLMMLGEQKSSYKLPSVTSEQDHQGRNQTSNRGDFSESAIRDTTPLTIAEAATQLANDARNHLAVEQMLEEESRDSRIYKQATEGSAIADMLSFYAKNESNLFSYHQEPTQDVEQSAFQKAATWEVVVNESFQVAKAALDRAQESHDAIEKKLNSHVERLNSAVGESKEAHLANENARRTVGVAAVNATGAIPAALVGHFGPIIAEGTNLTIAAIRSKYKEREAGKKDKAVVTLMNDLEYAVAKEGILRLIKDRAAQLYDELEVIKENAERSLLDATSNGNSEQFDQEKQRIQTSVKAFNIKHAEKLVAWADRNKLTAERETGNQVARHVAESYRRNANKILNAIRSHAELLQHKNNADQELSRAKRDQIALESLLDDTQATPDRNVQQLKSSLEEAKRTVIGKGNSAQAATTNLAKVENRLNIWNNLRAYNTVVVANQLSSMQQGPRPPEIESSNGVPTEPTTSHQKQGAVAVEQADPEESTANPKSEQQGSAEKGAEEVVPNREELIKIYKDDLEVFADISTKLCESVHSINTWASCELKYLRIQSDYIRCAQIQAEKGNLEASIGYLKKINQVAVPDGFFFPEWRGAVFSPTLQIPPRSYDVNSCEALQAACQVVSQTLSAYLLEYVPKLIQYTPSTNFTEQARFGRYLEKIRTIGLTESIKEGKVRESGKILQEIKQLTENYQNI